MTNAQAAYIEPEETSMEFLRRAVSWLDMNSEDLLSDLPTPEACLDFFRLISEDYDVSTFEEIMCCIEEGLATPDKLGEFVVKWGLDKKWKFDIDTRQHRMVAKAIRLHKAMAARKAEGK